MQIDNDPKLINWLNQVCLSKTNNTRELYTTVMKKYCSIVNMTPSMLIEQCENESVLAYSKQSLPIHIGNFKNYIRENMSRTSRVTYLAAISSFYAAHEISVPKKLMKREVAPEISIENDLSITDKDITAAINVSD